MKTKCIYILMLLFGEKALAQSIVNYTSARTTGNTYSSIVSTGTAVSSWRNTGAFSQDDNRSDFINIGFDFWYNGVRYTQVSASTNGYLDFSSSTDDGGPINDDFGYDNTAFTNATAGMETRPAIAPFYDDLTAAGGGAPLGNAIKYHLGGSAPNRVFTLEWIDLAVYGNTTPDLDFQVKLYEGTGVVEIVYDTMDTGTNLFSYTTGINAPTMSAPPLATQLKTLQTANTNTFSQVVQNNLSTMPVRGSKYSFTPPTPTAASGTLTFSAVTTTGMTVTWPNWATNEVGYVVYNSTDGINYQFVVQRPVNSVSAAITGLLPSTTYYWRVQAVTEGSLSAALTGTRATNPAGNKVSVATGNWNTAGTWTPVGVPTAGDNVTIANGHTVTIDVAAVCNKLTVGQGISGRLQFTGITPRSITVNDSIKINVGGAFFVNPTSTVTHTATFKNHIINNGEINFATGATSLCNLSLTKNGDINLTGNPSTNQFNLISLNLANIKTNTFHIQTPIFSAANNFLTLTSGTFKISSSSAANITPFTALTNINANSKIFVNSPNVKLSTGAGINLYGDLEITAGVVNIGDAAAEDIVCFGANIRLSGGNLNIAGKVNTFDINNLLNLNISGGVLTVPTVGSTSTTVAPFSITSAGSTFAMSGGTIIIQREGGSGAEDLGYVNIAALGNTTAGVLQIGDASTPASQTMNIQTNDVIPNLLVASANATAKLITYDAKVLGNIQITAGVLDANNRNITLGGNWDNSGGLFLPGTSTVTFNGAFPQTLSRTGGETFNHLVFSSAGIKTLASNISCGGNVHIQAGATVDLSSSNYTLEVRGNFINDGTLNTQKGMVSLTGSVAQSLGGLSMTDFYNLTLNNTAGVTLNTPANLKNALSIANGTFNLNTQTFTLLSTAEYSGHITAITGTGDISGDVTAQRFIPGGSTGWAIMGQPFSSSHTFADLDDDIIISCPTCPDGYTGYPSIYAYDETAPGLFDELSSYIGVNDLSESFAHKKGYYVYTGDGPTTTNDLNLDMVGSVAKFNQTIPLTYTSTGSTADDGWNLISNPYPCPISWNLLKGATSNIDNAIYVYNADLSGGLGGFASYVNGISSPDAGSGGQGDTIAMFQGFIVHSTGATALNAQESNKVSGNPTFLRTGNTTENQTASTTPALRLKIQGNGFLDETVLYYQSGATPAFDASYDALKLPPFNPGIPQIALIGTDSQAFQINAIEPINGSFTAPLKTTSYYYPGSYTILASGVNDLPPGTCVRLTDLYTGAQTNLRDSVYSFTLSDTTQSPRFTLTIQNTAINLNTQAIQPTCDNPQQGMLVAQSGDSLSYTYSWYNEQDSLLQEQVALFGDTLVTPLSGMYFLQAQDLFGCAGFMDTLFIQNIILPNALASLPDTLFTDTLFTTNISQNADSYLWDFGDGSVDTNTQAQHIYLANGTYPVQLIATSSSGCVDSLQHSLVVLGVVITDQQEVIEPTNPWVSVSSFGNNWLLDIHLTQEEPVYYYILNTQGQLLYENQAMTKQSQIQISTQGLATGIYILNVQTPTQKQAFKLFWGR